MTRKLSLIFIMSALILGIFSAVTSAQFYNASVNTAFLNMRSGPSIQFGVVAQLARGQALNVVGRDAGNVWVQGVLPNGLSGWVNSRYLALSINILNLPITSGVNLPLPITPTPVPPVVSANAFVTANFLNIRNGPGANFSIVGRVSRGQGMTVTGRNAEGSWALVNVPNVVNNGWVSLRFISTNVNVFSLPIVSNTGVNPPFVDPIPVGGSSGIVNTPQLNLRRGSSIAFGVITQLQLGEGVNLVARNSSGSWLLVQIADGRTGWVNARFINTGYPIFNLPVR
jgi:N-acetylmuramoyl-L-alanine amidase